ncbi:MULTISPECIES: S9 family peptidase [Micromonospora]|uniref:alpha/beta hydrolase family protein n=1 Tax=Micromonospora TaxID=1873 RepID=UPI001EF7FAAA|nr:MULTISPECIES: hypothetical protein [Micromonospora]
MTKRAVLLWIHGGRLGRRDAGPAPRPARVDATVATHLGTRVPVLLVHGREDASVPAGQALELARRLLAAGHPAHAWLTHGGHALDLARPDIRAVTAAFLDTVLRVG